MKKRKEKKAIIELYDDLQKAYDYVNHAFLEKLLEAYDFPPGVQSIIVEMMARWRIRLSYGDKKEVGDVRLTNGILQGDAFSPLLFVMIIDPLIKIFEMMVGDGLEVHNYSLFQNYDNIFHNYDNIFHN